MQVVILCGGKGTRMEKETEFRPKPMIEIGSKPALWHIMNIYSAFGFRDFILCLGYKGEVIKNYFLNFASLNADCTVNTKSGTMTIHAKDLPEWNVTMVDTGIDAMTGARIKRIERFIDADDFMLTYGDVVANINLTKLLAFHRKHRRIATMTGVFPRFKSRFGELSESNNAVIQFIEKPVNCAALTNGGFFVLQKGIFQYLSDDDSCVFEKDALEQLVTDRQLYLYKHDGFWYCMDTARDLQFLNSLWAGGAAPWDYQNKKRLKRGKNWKAVLDHAY